jgi:ribonuclease J
MNVNLYGTEGKWLMVDLGMTFSGNEYPGAELVFADLAFIEERREDLLGIVLTHAHEDHIGAVPYFAADLDVPLYATPFTAKLVAEAGRGRAEPRCGAECDRPSRSVQPGAFRHPLCAAGAFDRRRQRAGDRNAAGPIFHTGDWKLDDEPLIGTPATPRELTEIGDEGVLALVCDSTNVFNPNPSGSEGAVARAMRAEVARHKGKRVVVTTFASNVARLQTLGEVAAATGRRLCVVGRSLDRIIRAAQGCGYLGSLPDLVDVDTAMACRAAGADRGHRRAGRTARRHGPHRRWQPSDEAAIGRCGAVFQPPDPGNEIAIGRIQNQLAGQGITVVTDRQAEIHVSGHPGRPELEALYGWIRPKSCCPCMAKCATCRAGAAGQGLRHSAAGGAEERRLVRARQAGQVCRGRPGA